MTALCVYPSCVRCHRCEAAEQTCAGVLGELEGLRATVRAIELLPASDPVIGRMCRAALEGFYPAKRAAA